MKNKSLTSLMLSLVLTFILIGCLDQTPDFLLNTSSNTKATATPTSATATPTTTTTATPTAAVTPTVTPTDTAIITATATPTATPTNIVYNLNSSPGTEWSVCSSNCDWQWGTVSNVGPVGAVCYGTNISGDYVDNRTFAQNYVQLGALNFSGFASATGFRLTFDAYFNLDYSYDFAQIQYSTNGTTFNEITAAYVSGYPYVPNNSSPSVQNTWSPNPASDTPQWRTVTVNLGGMGLNGQTTVYFRWVLSSDETYTGPGFYIDNVNIGY